MDVLHRVLELLEVVATVVTGAGADAEQLTLDLLHLLQLDQVTERLSFLLYLRLARSL